MAEPEEFDINKITRSEKICIDCQEIKPITAFAPHPRCPDGHIAQCHPCKAHSAKYPGIKLRKFLCRVCDCSFEEALAAHNTRKQNICPPCREWHAWCSGCQRPHLRSDFASSRSAENGLQTNCRLSRSRVYGAYRPRTCAGCHVEFITPDNWNRGASTIWICSDCSQTSKHCAKCNTVKPLAKFNIARGKANGNVAHCRACRLEQYAMIGHKEQRAQRLKKTFGLTTAQYESMLRSQGGVCAICKLPEKYLRPKSNVPKPLAVDHDHETSAVRDLLCGACNSGLGYFEDNTERLRAAARYVERHRDGTLDIAG